MASKNTSSSPNGRQKVQRSNSDSARWVAGLLLLFIGLFAASAVLFSFFTWSADQSGLLLSPEERATLGVEPGNLCGWAGARLGRMLVDNSFGVSGILIPVMVLLVGVRVIRQRPLLFNHSILSLFLVLILSSLTLGFAFSDKWSLCSSTGWGGAFGIETAALLRTHIGVLGTLILLLGCWILTGYSSTAISSTRSTVRVTSWSTRVAGSSRSSNIRSCTRTGNRPMPPGMRLP